MVDGWDSGFGSDDEPPAAPPEEEDADEAVPVQELLGRTISDCLSQSEPEASTNITSEQAYVIPERSCG